MSKRGFTLIEGLLILVIIGLLGGAGWYVWQAKEKSDNSLDSSGNTEFAASTKHEVDKVAIPEGYIKYENRDFGFSFAYPGQIGNLSPGDTGDNPNFLLYDISVDKNGAFSQGSQGRLLAEVNKFDNFCTRAGKYGPFLKPSTNLQKWLVSSCEGSEVYEGEYKDGDVYPAKVTKTVKDSEIFDFSFQDEGCYRANWVVNVKGGYLTLTMPSVCGSLEGGLTKESKDEYQKTADKVISTFVLL